MRRAEQAAILDKAERFVKPGGRLVYVTCSVFSSENGDQMRQFLAANPHFAACRPRGAVRRALSGQAPAWRGSIRPAGIMLSPLRSGTDGFYFAALRPRSLTGALDGPDHRATHRSDQRGRPSQLHARDPLRLDEQHALAARLRHRERPHRRLLLWVSDGRPHQRRPGNSSSRWSMRCSLPSCFSPAGGARRTRTRSSSSQTVMPTLEANLRAHHAEAGQVDDARAGRCAGHGG